MDQIKKLRQLPLLFVFAAGVIGAQLWSFAVTEREHASLVQPEPLPMTAAELVANRRLENRHVSIFECWFGEGLAYRLKKGSQEIQYVYIPVYPADVERETTGDNIRLLACFTNVRNIDELKEAMQADGLTGFIWDDKVILDDVRKNLLANYPQINLQRCRVVNIGESYPTVAQADQYVLMSYVSFAIGLLLASWYFARNVQRFLGLANDPENAVPHAEQSPLANTPSAESQAWRQFGVRAAGALAALSVPVGAVICVLMLTSRISYDSFVYYMAACFATVLFGCWVSFGNLIPRYEEHVYQPVEPHELQRPARIYFERHTPELLALGFQLIGDVKASRSINMISRDFLSHDGETMATLSAGMGITAHGFSSITADGVSHNSSSVDTSRMHEPSLPRRVQTVTGSIAAGYAAHRTMVTQHTQQSGAEVLSIQPDEIRAVNDYQHRISSWRQYKTGVSKHQPPRLEPFESIAALKKARDARLRAEVDVRQL